MVSMFFDEDEYLRWVSTAKRTLESARGDLARGDYNWACFKAQQAAELAVKALLHGFGMPAYGYSVSRLISDISSRGITVPGEVMYYAKTLDKYYIPTRYPNAWVEGVPYEYYVEQDAVNAIKYVEEIISWVEDVWRSLRRGGG